MKYINTIRQILFFIGAAGVSIKIHNGITEEFSGSNFFFYTSKLSALAASTIFFTLNKFFVFFSYGKKVLRQFARFSAVHALALALYLLTYKCAISEGASHQTAISISLIMTGLVSFIVQKKYVFKK